MRPLLSTRRARLLDGRRQCTAASSQSVAFCVHQLHISPPICFAALGLSAPATARSPGGGLLAGSAFTARASRRSRSASADAAEPAAAAVQERARSRDIQRLERDLHALQALGASVLGQNPNRALPACAAPLLSTEDSHGMSPSLHASARLTPRPQGPAAAPSSSAPASADSGQQASPLAGWARGSPPQHSAASSTAWATSPGALAHWLFACCARLADALHGTCSCCHAMGQPH